MVDLDAWVPLAEVARPHGVRGEVRLRVFNAASDALLAQEEVLVRLKSGEEHEVSVERARRADEAILMKLFSVDDRDRADALRGALVCVRRRDFPAPEDGEFYAVDAVGAEVRLVGAEPAPIGVVASIIDYPTVQALRVAAADGLGDWEIPLTEAYVRKVDLDARIVEVHSLEDLDREPVKKKKSERDPAKTDGD